MKYVSLAALALATGLAGTAAGQQAEPEHSETQERRGSTTDREVPLQPVEVVDTAPSAGSYGGFDPIDTGRTIVGERSIRDHESGEPDMLDALRLVPGIQFDINQRSVSRDDLLDLRPSDISISGGPIYDNNIRLDGVGVNSVHDVTNDNALNWFETSGAAAQTIFVDPSLIQRLEVQDSNISARYGDFTGGVVDAVIREPERRFGGRIRFGYEDDNLVNYIYNDEADLDRADVPPSFHKWRFNASIDIPLSDRAEALISYGRNEARVDYRQGTNYGGEMVGRSALSETWLIKGVLRARENLRLTGSLVYSPYESEAASPNGRDNLVRTQGGGLTVWGQAEGRRDDTDWRVRLSYADADMTRRAPPANFNWSSAAPSIDFCTASSCTEGGGGDLDQYQRDLTLEADFSRPLAGGTLNGGVELAFTDAFRERQTDHHAYLRGSYNPLTVCASAADPACIDGEIALTTLQLRPAYEAQVDFQRRALWAEYRRAQGPFEIRAGLRYSWNDFLDNHNVAPRLSASWELPNSWTLSGGLNRYYGQNMVGYAIRAQYPDLYIYDRTGQTEGGSLVFSLDDWTLTSHNVQVGHRMAELSTPYSDEATAALTIPVWIGVGRLKAVYREHRDQFARLPQEVFEESDGQGGTYERRVWLPSNDGRTDHLGFTAEYVAGWRNHALTLNFAWTETTTNFGDYFDTVDLEAKEAELLVYNGQIMSRAELENIAQRENFARPLAANASLQSDWFGERLRTTVWVSWLGEYETIASTSQFETIDSVRYRVWEDSVRPSTTRVDLNAEYRLPMPAGAGQARVEARISNLFEALPYTDVTSTFPYQRGRSIWLGMNYAF
ncbi:TonB-dependent receptor plug domain-containing protein [Glycocaulis alkaliphilus]|nr:TonB-dependent receptor plug domain-containing protein [Glycocaulis alkaliphilus]GGB78292.1 TonB-dependent receptor [Glycocaulis alkaliphilus]